MKSLSMHRRSRILVGAVAVGGVALAASTAVVPATAYTTGHRVSAASAADPHLGSLVVAQGTIRSRAGKGVGAGTVLLQAWPGPDVLRKLEPGDEVKVVTVGRATTGSDGSYQLRVGAAGREVLRRYATDTGLVDLDVVAPGSGAPPFSFSRRLVSVDSGTLLERPDSAPGLPLAQTRAPEVVDLVGEDVQAAVPSAEPTEPALEKNCSTRLKEYVGKRRVLVGQAYSNANGVPTKFTYSEGATSTLGVAVSTNGQYGNWKSSGTNTREAKDSLTFPANVGTQKHYYDSWFRYGKYKTTCSSGIVGPIHPWSVRAAYWAGGADERALASSPKATYCVNYLAGAEYTKEDSNAVTWSNGADTSGPIGIDLSVRTGYRTSAKLHYNFKKKRALCGTHDYPGNSPRRLVVRLAQ